MRKEEKQKSFGPTTTTTIATKALMITSNNSFASPIINFSLWLISSFCIVGSIIYLFINTSDTFRDYVVFVESYNNENNDVSSLSSSSSCDDRFRSIFPAFTMIEESLYDKDNVPIISLHRNGEPEPCGSVQMKTLVEEMKAIYETEECSTDIGTKFNNNKYQFESLLTETFSRVLSKNSCHSTEDYDVELSDNFLGFCDMGEDHTPILLDHDKLVPVTTLSKDRGDTTTSSLPCHFHTRVGLRVTRFELLSEMMMSILQGDGEDQQNNDECQQIDDDNSDEKTQTCISKKNEEEEENLNKRNIHLYAVPAGRLFFFAPSFVGEFFYLPHVPGASDKAIYLEVLSLKPRVFDVFNFFSRDESDEIVERAEREKSESHRIKRSTTGAGTHSVNSRRTSESGFDTTGKTAVKVKRRCFAALGFDEYIESHSDGLQILRYNVSKAYNSHLDFIEDNSGQLKHDYESSGTGGNRFATILMYMSDLGDDDGGETVFPHGRMAKSISGNEARDQLRATSVLNSESWEEDLAVMCRTRLSIKPHSSRAVLFYSQHPNGQVDRSSLHGACPVLSNQKYAANLWVWNTPRSGFSGSPIKKKFQNENGGAVTTPEKVNPKISGEFRNTGKDPKYNEADLFYEDQFWDSLRPGDPARHVNTFQGHVWNVKVKGEVLKTWTVSNKKGSSQKFVV